MDFKMLTIFIISGAVPLATALSGYKEDKACHEGKEKEMTSVKCLAGSACFNTTVTAEGSVLGKKYIIEATVRGCLNAYSDSGNQCRSVDGDAATAELREITGITKASGTGFICTSDNCNGDAATAGIRGITGSTKASGTGCICTSDNCNGQSMSAMPAPAIFTFVISLILAIFVSL